MPNVNTFYVDLSAFITQSRQSILDTKNTLRSKRLSEFSQRVINEGLSYDTQIAFWEAEQQREATGEFPNQDYVKEAKDAIATSKKLNRAKSYRDSLARKQDEITQLSGTYDGLKSWLEGQLATAVDDDLRKDIQNQLTQTNTTIYQNLKNGIDDLISTGERDNSLDVLKDADSKIDSQMAKAIASGNTEEQNYWGLKKTIVKQDSNSIKAQNAVNDYQISSLRGDDPITLLDKLNNSINNATNDDVNIWVGGTKYDGIKNYVETERGKYINDTSTSGLLYKLRTQDTAYIEKVANQVGVIPDKNLDELVASYNKLKNRPELAGIADKLNNILYDDTGVMTKALDKNTKQIISDYSANLNYLKATKELARLAQKYGMDLKTSVNMLTENYGAYRKGMLDQVIGTAERLYSGTEANPSTLTWEQAVQQATDAAVGGIYSPEEMVNRGISDLAMEAKKKGTTAVKAKGIVIPNADVTPEKVNTGTAPTNAQQPAVSAPAAPSTPNVAGSSDYEKALDVQGDANKQKTLSGWGYQWQWSDQANKIGGWIPVSTEAKAKFKTNYGVDFNPNKKVTLALGAKKVVAFGTGKYASGLFNQGYKKI